MSAPVFYVPTLLRQAAPANTPSEAAFFPAMRTVESADAGGLSAAAAAEMAAASALPLDRAEARSILAEMLRQGEELAADGQLKNMAALAEKPGKDLSLRAEMNELDAFASGRPSFPTAVRDWGAEARQEALRAEGVRRALVDCQKVLLLAAFQEERMLESMMLQAKAEAAEAALLAALGEGEPGAPKPLSAVRSAAPWRVVVDAALPFLPEGGVLLTLDETMAFDMKDAGMLQPFPENRASLVQHWPGSLAEGLLYASLPAWRLVGRKRPAPERPWLNREIEVLAARPEGGWAGKRVLDAATDLDEQRDKGAAG